MKVRNKTTVTEAFQWFPDTVVPGVRLVLVMIQYNDAKDRYYIKGAGVKATRWAEVNGAAFFGFDFWDVKDGVCEPISPAHSLYKKFAALEKWRVEAEPYGVIDPPGGTGNIVRMGDWVVPYAGTISVLSHEDFKKSYEVVS